ncbi:hypothetical protein CHS0354_002764 [Potamilus streckersoni]|uniref:Integrator complex subunit 3 n=1 Tax=Potamilus streckersoni TaxID=2493646 RepID=A0AAE0SNH3_9BIVA|nr:hypothetical protein CHS0354_002764 [Potamilus streckersoni]
MDMEQQQAKPQQSRLLITTVLEPKGKDELDERLERCFSIVFGLTNGLSEREANNELNTHVCKGAPQHEEIQLGLLNSILTDPPSASKSYRDMNLTSRDGLTTVLTKINQIIFEKWLRLQDTSRQQMIWFIRELVKNSILGTDSVVHNMMRQIAGGDITPKNIWLAENILDILTENKVWLEKYPALLATAVYTYLRIIIDHTNPMFSNLRQREVEFIASSLREKWNDCMVIGRDLVRLLQNVARISEFESIWRDIMLNPTNLSSNFTGISQLLQIRTSRKYLIHRLTPDMETKLVFLTTKVKFGQHKRYQDWFQRQYLSTPESQSLRCDLIRYICCVFHPPNELLCSDIIPRWAVIGWLLTTCTSNVAASNAKLSLFYDWFFFDPEKDSIMNVEPGILVMYHSMRPHPAITATLLDFLCRIMNNFCPALLEPVKAGIFTSLRTILDKRVLQSLSPLFDNPKLDKELRSLIRDNFSEFCSQDVKEDPSNNNNHKEVGELDNGNHILDNNMSEAAFSDEEEEIPLRKLSEDFFFRPICEIPRYQPIDITDHLQQLFGDIRDYTMQLQSENDQETQCEIMDRLMQTVVTEEDFDQDTATTLATCLCQILINQFSSNLLPQELDDESIEDSTGTPLFVMLRFLSSTPEEDPNRLPLLQLLGEMYSIQPRIGYHLLYFLKVGKINDEKMATYRDFCKGLDNRDLKSCLISDLKLCQEDDVRLFTFLMPDIYTHFPSIAVGNAELLHMIVSSIDGTQLQDLICQILQGHLVMFRKDSFLSILNASLEWETLEQYFLWQLITAHNIPVEHIMPILPKLEFTTHAEALTSILCLLKQESPTSDMLRPILCRECKHVDLFTVSILKYWAQEYEDKLADLVQAQLTKSSGSGNTPKKRQKTNSKKDYPSIDQILGHLDHMRQVCRNISFLNHENIQHALQQVQQTASDSQKTKYSDLLALADDIEDMKTTRVLRGLPGRKAAAAAAAMAANSSSSSSVNLKRSKKLVIDDSESESESSEDEGMKPKSKKRKKSTPMEEDSD